MLNIPGMHVLLVEDSADDAELIVLSLQQSGVTVSWERVETPDDLRAALKSRDWDVVLSDFNLPGFSALAALNIVRAVAPDLPFIVVSGTVGEDFAVEMMQADANDYVLKSNLSRLAPAINRELRQSATRLARRRAEAATRQMVAIVNSCEDAIISYTRDGTITSWNPGAERLFGWTQQEVLGKSVELIVPPDLLDNFWTFVKRIWSGIRDNPFDTTRVRKDATLVDVALTNSPIRNEHGDIVAACKIARDITERKRAERSLRRSEERLRKVIESEMFGLGFWDAKGGFSYANEALLKFVGRTKEDLQVGRVRWDDATPPEHRALDQNALDEIARTGRCTPYQKEFVRDDGSRVPVLLGAASLRDNSDPDYGDGVAVFLDVTALKQAQDDLKRQMNELRMVSEERREILSRLQLQIERMPIAYVVYDAELRYAAWNPAAEKIFGYHEREVLGRPLMFLVPPDAHVQVESIVNRLRAGDIEAHSVNQNATKDGRLITCEWHNTPLKASDGTFLGVLSMVIDITNRARTEEALKIRDRAIQAVTQGILITDSSQPDEPLIYVSPGFERMTGYTAADVLGKNCRLLQGPGTNQESIAMLRAAVRSRNECTVELLNYRKDGTTFWNELSIAPVVDATGRLTNFVGVQTDVTERRRLEEQFRQSQKMEAVGALAGGIAHDFNNLLTIINGYCEMLFDLLTPTNPARELLEKIEKAGSRATTLTRQLLAFSRKEILNPQLVNLNEIIIQTNQMLQPLMGEDIRLTTILSTEPGSVKVDRGQMEQVLMNLAINAREAMPTGGQLSIETRNIDLDENYVRVHAGSNPGPHVLLAISDSGCGMTAEVLTHIFEPFFTTKGPGKGTGLGLATVFGIVKQCKGHIEVVSEVGRGTSFKVYLPRVETDESAALMSSQQQEPKRGTETILLVEDETEVRKLSREILTAYGYKVLDAADGHAALKIAAEYDGPVQMLITDVVMPFMGGREVAGRIGGLHPELLVLFVSGYTDDAVVRHGILQDHVNFLSKPFSAKSLAYKVREILDSVS